MTLVGNENTTRQLRFAAIVLFVGIVVALAGCSIGEPDQAPQAEERISEANSSVQRASIQLQSAKSLVLDAEEKGVNTTNASRKIKSAEANISRARTSLQEARTAYENEEYSRALALANESIDAAQSGDETLNDVEPALEAAYQRALEQAKKPVQEAFVEYQVAVAYVEAAKQAGGDTSNLEDTLASLETKIQNAKSAINEGRNPRRARQLASTIHSEAKQVQDRSITVGKRGAATQAIGQVSARTESEFAQEYIDASRQARNHGDLDQVETALVTAQYAEQLVQYERTLEGITGKTGLDTTPYQERVEQKKTAIQNGNRPDLTSLNRDVNQARDTAEAIDSARVTLTRAKQQSSLLYSVNITEANSSLHRARELYEQGKLNASQQQAANAQELAAQQIERAETYYETHPIARIVRDATSVVSKFFGPKPPQERTIRPVENIQITRPDISFSPPARESLNITRLSFTSSTDIPGVSIKGPSENVAFDFSKKVIDCGYTCREVTGTVTNTGTTTAHNVRVEIIVEVEGDEIKRRTVELGDLAPGESDTRQDEITVSYGQAVNIYAAGELTIRTKIISDEKTNEYQTTYEVRE